MNTATKAPALSVQLHHTARLLDRVMQGESTQTLLDQVPSSLRPGVQALLMTSLRHAALSRAACEHLLQKPPARPVVALLQTALALMNAEPCPYAPHTLVNQTIEAAKSQRNTHQLGKFQRTLASVCKTCRMDSASRNQRRKHALIRPA